MGRLSRVAGVVAALGGACAHAAGAQPTVTPVPLDDAALSALPSHAVHIDVHGTPLDCDAVNLRDLLQAQHAMPATPLRGAQLAQAVRVVSRDGYRVVFGLAELDPTLGAREVDLTRRCNGRPLDADTGPWRLLVPSDARPARAARQVERIELIDLSSD